MNNSQTTYIPESSILFLSICSRTKNEDPGVPEYTSGSCLEQYLSEGKTELLKFKRNELKELLPEIMWGKKRFVSELAMNRNLKNGSDFAGTEEGHYMPAILRYQGKFYFQGLGGGENARDAVYSSGHHFLILSGLYGLVSADEPVQLYTCPVEVESVEVQTFWRRVDALTRIFVEYIQNAGIKRIFDLTARSIYRDLINWELVKEQTEAEILHCFSEEAAGDAALADYGRFAREYLLPKTEEELLNIMPDSPYNTENGTFFLGSATVPPESYPREPVIILPEGESEDDLKKMRDYINFRLDEFERNLVDYLKEKEKRHRELIYALDVDRRKDAEIRRKQYLQEYPMEKNVDLSLIDFLEYGDYQAIILGRWPLFKDDFGKQATFKDNFDRIRKMRNRIKHNNPIRSSEIRTGEGILLWFEDVMRKDNA